MKIHVTKAQHDKAQKLWKAASDEKAEPKTRETSTRKLQHFLKKHVDEKLEVTGKLDKQTKDAWGNYDDAFEASKANPNARKAHRHWRHDQSGPLRRPPADLSGGAFDAIGGVGGIDIDWVGAPGNVDAWIMSALKAAGIPATPDNIHALKLIIQHESGGNPQAINRWDSNAAAGHPSQGLMQTIPSTFAAYALPGHNKILNPVDNIIAGARYAISRYGSLSNVPGVKNVMQGGSYVGY